MYSYEDRVRAVKLFIKLGKRVRATIRQLGYLTKNALKGWHREYEQRLDLPVGYPGRGPKYSQAQKKAAVEHYLIHDRCIAATMRALGYPGGGTFTAWFMRRCPRLGKLLSGGLVVQAIPRHWGRPESSAFAVDKKVPRLWLKSSAYAGRRCTTVKTSYSAQRIVSHVVV